MFSKAHKQGTPDGNSYHALKSAREKSDVRVAWAQAKYEEQSAGSTFDDSFSKVDCNVGVFHPLGRIVVEEGGWTDESAIVAAKKYVARCILIGGDFLSYNDVTERMEYLYIKNTRIG